MAALSLELNMEFSLDEFVSVPTMEVFNKCTKENLLLLAEHYKVEVSKQSKKATIKAELFNAFAQRSIFPPLSLPKSPLLSASDSVSDENVRLKELELELERLAVKERELYYLNVLEQKKLEQQTQIRLREMELEHVSSQSKNKDFDVSKNIRLVPPFNEKDVDKYFILFERVALTLKWPKEIWTLLLQSTLIGKAQVAYASLGVEDSLDFDKVKASVLRAYELVPEAYRQKFRKLRKNQNQTYAEFVREKEILFDRWCTSQNVKDFAQLKQLIMLEEFKNCLPEKVTTYLNEHKVTEVSKAAILVDEYVLTHKSGFVERPFAFVKFDRNYGNGKESQKSVSPSAEQATSSAHSGLEIRSDSLDLKNENVTCFYCKKKGHVIVNCPVLKKKNTKPVALIKTVSQFNESLLPVNWCEYSDFKPFVMDGFVSLSGDNKKVPVKILRDTAASQSFILAGVLALDDKTAVGSNVPVRGFNMQDIGVPLHRIVVQSDLWSGVRPGFPIPGVSVIMGNDLAGGRVLVTPDVTPVPIVIKRPDKLAQKYPEVFTSCAVTRAAAKRIKEESNDDIDLSETFFEWCLF